MTEADLTILGSIPERWATPPADQVNVKPQPLSRDDSGQPEYCETCHGRHRQPAIHLDYFGHAYLRLALIAEDPAWNWEPLASTPEGLPVIEKIGKSWTMWIRLTVRGVTRLGIGTAPETADGMKELIGDALRNAAQSFGFATKLWAKEDARPVEESDRPAARSSRTSSRPSGSTTKAAPPASGAQKAAQSPKAATYRSREEAVMNGALERMSEENRKNVRQAFATHFGSTLSKLPPNRHAEAAVWMADIVEKQGLAEAAPAA